jgi:ATP-dependent DNA helicase RecG
VGNSIAVFGKLEFRKGFQIIHPEFDILEEGEDPVNTGKILPQYPSTSALKAVGLEGRGFRRIISTALDLAVDEISDYFNLEFVQKEGLFTLHEALHQIHNPDDLDSLKKAIYRLKFDEHFYIQLLMALKKQAMEDNIGRTFSKQGKYEKDIYNSLDFELTNAQISVLKDIRNDLAQNCPMNRLIQGDVGSGKTIVAVLSAAIVISHGSQ